MARRPTAATSSCHGAARALSKASVALSLDHSFSVDGDGSTPGRRAGAPVRSERLDGRVEIEFRAPHAIDAMLPL